MQTVSQWVLFLCVAIGGALGSVSRFYLSWWVQATTPGDFPYGILCANLLGCFLIGFLAAILLPLRSVAAELWRVGLMIGVLGGFTTFSSFSLDNFKLLQQGAYLELGANVAVSVLGGLCLTAVGWCLGRLIFAR